MPNYFFHFLVYSEVSSPHPGDNSLSCSTLQPNNCLFKRILFTIKTLNFADSLNKEHCQYTRKSLKQNRERSEHTLDASAWQNSVANKDHQKIIVDPIFMIVQGLGSFLNAVTPTAVVTTVVILPESFMIFSWTYMN